MWGDYFGILSPEDAAAAPSPRSAVRAAPAGSSGPPRDPLGARSPRPDTGTGGGEPRPPADRPHPSAVPAQAGPGPPPSSLPQPRARRVLPAPKKLNFQNFAVPAALLNGERQPEGQPPRSRPPPELRGIIY